MKFLFLKDVLACPLLSGAAVTGSEEPPNSLRCSSAEKIPSKERLLFCSNVIAFEWLLERKGWHMTWMCMHRLDKDISGPSSRW